MYLVLDDCGTRKVCWSLDDAMAWFPYCSKHAYVVGRVTGKIYAQRHVN